MDKIYTQFYKQRVFSLQETKKIYKNYQVCKNALSRLLQKQRIRKVKAGLYHIIPIDDPDYLPDSFLIGSKLKPTYFFSHATALQIRALMDAKTIYISTHETKDFHYYGKHFKMIATSKFFGIETIHHGPYKVRVSDRERTLLDCLDRLAYVSSFDELLGAYSNTKLDMSKIHKYLKLYGKKKLYGYTGYILEILQDQLDISSKDLDKIEKKLGNKVYYLEQPKSRMARIRERITKSKPSYNKRWKLIVPSVRFNQPEEERF